MGMFWTFNGDVLGMHRGCFGHVLGMSWACVGNVLRMLGECFEDVLGMIWAWYVLGLFWECFGDGLGMPRACLGYVLHIYQPYFRHAWDMLERRLEPVGDMWWRISLGRVCGMCLGYVQGMISKYRLQEVIVFKKMNVYVSKSIHMSKDMRACSKIHAYMHPCMHPCKRP